MDGWLKGLIATTCLIVIAASGLYFWSYYQQQAHAKAVRAAIQKQADIRAECRQALADFHALTNSRTDPRFPKVQRTAETCAAEGYIPKRYWLTD